MTADRRVWCVLETLFDGGQNVYGPFKSYAAADAWIAPKVTDDVDHQIMILGKP